MQLAYVHPALLHRDGDGESVIHELGLRAGFEHLTKELRSEQLIVDHIVVHHEATQTPAECLLELAASWGAELIAAGRVGHSRVERLLMGSVSTDLVRGGRHSVLINHVQPPTSHPARQRSLSEASV